MEIRSTTISFSKGKAHNIDGILKQYDDLKKELQHQYENKGKPAIFRSKCRWVEKGEFKATKYLFNLEKKEL